MSDRQHGCIIKFNNPVYLLGFDIGSSSVKAALVHIQTRKTVLTTQSPGSEMPIEAPHPGWAEQDPHMWWTHLCIATKELLARTGINPIDIAGIGITYQMHGLVCVDETHLPLRPAIIWCDSRAVDIGNSAFEEIGEDRCLAHLLNSPGNFTASKLKWVKEYEPEVYARTYKWMLPGDYIAMKLTGQIRTTPAGLSEGMFWSFKEDRVADFVLTHYDLDKDKVPEISPVFSIQGYITEHAARETGLAADTPVTYRAGDQPNNALALGVLQPGQIAASGGTSGVVYGISGAPVSDPLCRVNSFMHVNHTREQPRIGVLLCINGTGSMYNWMRQNVALPEMTYQQMEQEAGRIPPGADGVRILSFGNGAERMIENRNPGAMILHCDFNRHTRAHLYRAALEGIACAFAFGMDIMKNMGIAPSVMRVGNDHLFQSKIFSNAFATLVDCRVDVIDTSCAIGAAKGAGIGAGIYKTPEEVVGDQAVVLSNEPVDEVRQQYRELFDDWREDLEKCIK